jgi:ribosome-binding factor A
MDFGPKSVKREQKTSLFTREISSLIQQLSLDEPALSKIFVTKVKLSADYGILFVYFSTYLAKADFDEALKVLKLYKPSLRKALASTVLSRHTPNLVFLYDQDKEKERKLNDLLDKVKHEDEALEKIAENKNK